MNRNDFASLGEYAQGTDAPQRATATALERTDDARSIVLVEGISDQIAVEAMAERFGRDLEAEGVVVVPIGGAQAVRKYASRFADTGVTISGLCDHNEREFFAAALPADAFFVCNPDLEAELVDGLDQADLEAVMEAEGDLAAFRTFQKQRDWRTQPFVTQLVRWFSAGYRRKSRYARLLVLAAPEERLPRPLRDLLARI